MRGAMEGLKILLEYEPTDDGEIAAEHDIIYAGSQSPLAMADTTEKLLNKLGWYWEDEMETWYYFT